ncbi:hypothetical protein V502_06543 [Pseudogymnoascus sp. VKM F-4520 (FW-2644)]|nr:hypothetical protein V502_06543 [Pseudogymnoascus sp. VKM F-4520 (FW-2644)]
MRFLTLSIAVLATASSTVLAADPELKIEVNRAVECERKTQRGDKVDVHYRGSLQADGSEFDASYNRGSPLSFVVGRGQVIKGWDEGLLDMCIGEKRTLTIPPNLGYGERNMGPIPAGSTLIFETELMGIKGVEAPASIVLKEAASEETEGIKEKIKAKVEEAAEAVKVTLEDTDGDGQEHNEL